MPPKESSTIGRAVVYTPALLSRWDRATLTAVQQLKGRVRQFTKRKALHLFRNTWKTTAAVVVTRNGENTRGWNGYALRPEVLLDE